MIREALRSLLEYRARALLTLSILAFGITALVGILTALDALRVFIATRLAGLGSQAFMISSGNEPRAAKKGRGVSIRWGSRESFQWWEMTRFSAQYDYPGAVVSPAVQAGAFIRAYYRGHKTPERLRLLGVDASYPKIQQLSLQQGRFFTPLEVQKQQDVIVLGAAVATTLFPDEDPLGKEILMQGRYFRVVGVLAPRGSLLGFNLDEECYIPWTTARRLRGASGGTLYVGVADASDMPAAIQKARQVLRTLRRLPPKAEDNFTFLRGEQLADLLLELISTISAATIAISLITLLGATLSFTNILLVIVKERTQEIGLRMALGATRRRIAWQFLSEAVVIALTGGLGGIGLGIVIGNAVALFLGSSFVMPWRWVLVSIALTTLVGLVAGYRPAQEAARLNPVDALRYE